ncbi:hypothetical protein BT93_E0970 [Corymbia citriodora subsp. variegata]|nr:hypothetical protein BT93_E0970 [Corymbia citriodora subsp. variegata]
MRKFIAVFRKGCMEDTLILGDGVKGAQDDLRSATHWTDI